MNAIHVVSAWASTLGLTLGQRRVDSKSNEITAIPEVLDMIDLQGTLVTIDAIGCQKSIARKIVDGGGDYTFALKDNHPKLCHAVESFFEQAHDNGLSHSKVRSLKQVEDKRGRVDERFYAVTSIPKAMKPLADQWPDAKSIGQAITISESQGEQRVEVRYYLSSRRPKVKEFSQSVRSHWSIESMHWILDVVFHEDASRIRTGYAAENMSFLRKFITTILKRDTSRGSMKGKRKRAGWNTRFLEKLPVCRVIFMRCTCPRTGGSTQRCRRLFLQRLVHFENDRFPDSLVTVLDSKHRRSCPISQCRKVFMTIDRTCCTKRFMSDVFYLRSC